MQNEEFRKLLVEYAEEISDPENKKVNMDVVELLHLVHASVLLWMTSE